MNFTRRCDYITYVDVEDKERTVKLNILLNKYAVFEPITHMESIKRHNNNQFFRNILKEYVVTHVANETLPV
jgi:hypothetical protein